MPRLPALLRSNRDILRIGRKLALLDSQFAPLIEHPIPFRIRNDRSPFEALLEAIVHQQLTGKAAMTIFGRVRALYPEGRPIDPRRLHKTEDGALRAAGLSFAKVAAIKDLATKTIDGTAPGPEEVRTLTDEEIIQRLTSIRGVGRWTVEMLLIFTMGRPDVFPVDDFAIRKSLGLLHGMTDSPTAKAALPLGDVWRPYRTVASLYLWNALNQR